MKKFGELEALRERMMALLAGVPEERLRRHPSPGKWSAAQIVDHLATAESRSVDYIRKKTLDPSAVPPAGVMCAVRSFALVAALASPFRFNAPAVVADTPDDPSPAEAAERWARTRAAIRSIIEELPEDLLRKALFRHPSAGRLNMSQTLDFMIAHVKRHTKQLRRTLSEVPNAPASAGASRPTVPERVGSAVRSRLSGVR